MNVAIICIGLLTNIVLKIADIINKLDLKKIEIIVNQVIGFIINSIFGLIAICKLLF